MKFRFKTRKAGDLSEFGVFFLRIDKNNKKSRLCAIGERVVMLD